MATNSPNYDALMDQIQTLSDLQNSGCIQSADPAAQTAYIKKLQEQADSIKKLLKLLNSKGSDTTDQLNLRPSFDKFGDKSNGAPPKENAEKTFGDVMSGSSRFSGDIFSKVEGKLSNGRLSGENVEYEQLWELSTTVCEEEVPEVEEEEDILDSSEPELLYENTGVAAVAHVTLSVEVPPPLPPRLPSRINLGQSNRNGQSEISSRSGNQSDRSDHKSQSVNSESGRLIGPSETSKVFQSRKSSKTLTNGNYDDFKGGGLDCSTPQLTQPYSENNRSCVTSTPRDLREADRQRKIQTLQKQREELISSLQSDDQERQWYYTQLQLIAQKIRSLPLTSPHSYSLENEAARQELEERAARIQSKMQRELGDPEQGLQRRKLKVQQVRELDRQLAEMDRVELRPELRGDEGPRRSGEEGGGAGRRGAAHPQSCNLEQLYHESIPMDRALSHSGPPAFGGLGEDCSSVMSFTSSVHSVGGHTGERAADSLDSNSLISLLGCTDVDKMSRTLLAMSSSPANCDMMRGSRCIPLLVQLLHLDPVNPNLPRPTRHVRARAARCLHNIVHAHPTDKHCKREAKVLKLLEVIRQYCDLLRDILSSGEGRGGGNSRAAAQAAGCRRVTIQVVEGGEKYQEQDLMVADFGNIGEGHPAPCKQVYACQHFLDFSGEARQAGQVINIEESMAVLTRCSFDESHRQPIFLLGGIPALAELIQVEHGLHPPTLPVCREVRRYAVVALTNLTFGNTGIKSYLCQLPGLVDILVGQLDSQWENLRKATAHLFRNLAWKADKASKSVLSESRVVSILMACAMAVAERCTVETPSGTAVEPGRDEPTLKVILSALWNLSAHCRKNKSEVCSTHGALKLLVQFLRSRSTAVVENGGGILRNISSYIATSQHGEQYRSVLRGEDCLSLLLSQLGSPSLTIVSNACGTLWNFSARSQEDQEILWELGAVPMLQSLTNSKHKTISTCSLAALKNLYTARPAGLFMMVSGVGTGQLTKRKVKNLVADLDEKLSDCGGRDVEEARESPGNSDESGSEAEDRPLSIQHPRSDSRNSVSSVPSVTSHYSDGRDRSSASPDRSLREKGMFGPAAAVPYQNLPPPRAAVYNADNSRHAEKPSGYSSDSPPPLPKRGEGAGFKGSLSAEGRFDGQYKSYVKQQYTDSNPRLGSPLRDNYLETETERVGSPANLTQAALSPGSIPLDLSKKKQQQQSDIVFTDEVELCEERPTDYSLRFQESEDPELLTSKPGDKSDQLFNDSVKTYYTEGTPLDTPYAFSTATSMSDLREPAIREEDEEVENLGDSTTAYAVEGTPVTFSRAESLTSLESGEAEGVAEGTKLTAIPETGEEKGMQETDGSTEKERESHTPPPVKDHKTVTFRGGSGANAHETPMMFSRASSIASLDSFDQHSIPDGYSSCDFSRATSGRVSPSDLPDSPSQTMPGSPRRVHAAAAPRLPMKMGSKPPVAPVPVKPMFGDGVKTFQEEGTPAVFSTRTSLSGLTFDEEKANGQDQTAKEAWPDHGEDKPHDDSEEEDDEEDIYADSESLLDQIINSGMPNSKTEKTSGKQSKIPQPGWLQPIQQSPRLNESGGGSDDSCCSAESTDILQACIASAMPSKTKAVNQMPPRLQDTSTGYSSKLGPRQAGEGAPAPDHKIRPVAAQIAKKMAPERLGPPPPPERKGSHLSHPCVAAAAACTADLSQETLREQDNRDKFRSVSAHDHLRTYRVEDTPINFSAATSLSDLTVDEPQASGRISVDSHDGLLEHRRGRRGPLAPLVSGTEAGGESSTGAETPLRFATEDTPAVFSRNDSLSSLEHDEAAQHKGCQQQREGGNYFQSHLPRPLTVGRSASSGSSTGGGVGGAPERPANKSFNSSLSSLSIDSLNNTNEDEEENLLADCISSAMPKSKSEHFDLSGRAKRSRKSPRREKSKSTEREPLRAKSSEGEPIRGNSRSPRNSRIIPGVVIPELRLKPRTPPKSRPVSGEMEQTFSLEQIDISQPHSEQFNPAAANPNLGGEEGAGSSDLRMEDEPDVFQHRDLNVDITEMTLTLTQSRISDLEGLSCSVIAREAGAVAASFILSQDLSLNGSLYSEAGEGLSMVQPPSLMLDSLPSLTQPGSLNFRRSSDVRLECRHTISGKLGSIVPLAVRRALGGATLGSVSQEDLSSLSSCQSNLDNIRPPTIMDDIDMENSMLSVASISSEVAAAVLAGSRGSDDTSASLTSEAILDIVRPAGMAVEAFCKEKKYFSMQYSESSISRGLESINPPTCMEDVTLVNSRTLVPEAGGTFVIVADEAGDTFADVTDMFDDESMVEPTLTTGSDAVDGEVPELPRDSRQATPAQSGGESSVETTPLPGRKLSPRQKRQMDPERYLTYTKSNVSTPREDFTGSSGYKSYQESQSSPGREHRSSRQQRLLDEDRFKTRTISKEDLVGTPQSQSPKSLKERRAEEVDRFRTHTIYPDDLSLSPQEMAILESEARLVVETITERKAEARSRSTSVDLLGFERSRSTSVEILREHEMLSIDADVASNASKENLIDIQEPLSGDESIPHKPRICKPWESRIQEEDITLKGVRGRRRVLYSPPMKRATVPPAVPPKPIQNKPRTTSSPVTSPRLVRGTRTMALRQATISTVVKKDPKTSPKTSPRSLNTSGSSSAASPRSVGSVSPSTKSRLPTPGSRTQSPISAEKPGLVRQGTFTKDDSPKSKVSGIPRHSPPNVNLRQASSVSLRGSTVNRTPPKIAPKPLFRRDTVQPLPVSRPIIATTKAQQLREKSLTRGGLRSSNSSTSSVTSKASTTSRTSIRTSSSNHSLRTAAEGVPRRTPSSSEIEMRRGYTDRQISPSLRKVSAPSAPGRPLSPATRPISPANRPVSPRQLTRAIETAKMPPPLPPPKKDVTSKIASLWKKVEDSKKQKKDNSKDKRVWISKGKVQEVDSAAPPPGRLIRSGTYEKLSDPPTVEKNPGQKEIKGRSRSRLSIKLSKFSLKRRGGTSEDQVNGNTPVSPDSDDLGNSLASELTSPADDEAQFSLTAEVKPRCGSESSESMSTGPDPDSDRKTSSQPLNRSPASAIVAPFNYMPHAPTLESLRKAQLKRNSSYVSSLGRKPEGQASSSSEENVAAKEGGARTRSSVVTLV